jgi:cytoskeletal protein RodZ
LESKFGDISFGKYLQSIRLEKRIPLEAVSKATRIGIENLLHIENESSDQLPAEVFVRGYLLAYARAIGADGDEVLRRYEASRQSMLASAKYDEAIARSRRTFWKRLTVSLLSLILLMVLSVGTVLFLQDTHREPPPNDVPHSGLKDTQLSEAADTAKATVESVSKRTPEQSVQTGPNTRQAFDSHILQIRATQKSWVKVMVDGGSAKRYNLNKDDNLVLEAKENFILLIGDAKGVELTLDDEMYEVTGKKGQVVTVQLP